MKRGGHGMRATPFVSRSPLKSDPTKPLKRTKGLTPGAPPARTEPAGDRAKTPQQKRRQAQLKTWAEVKEAAHQRDGWRCVGCGSDRDLDCQHRQNKGMGGRKTLDTIANALTLCRTCHTFADQHKNTEGAARGWTVPDGADPATWPIRAADGCLYLHGEDGERRRIA